MSVFMEIAIAIVVLTLGSGVSGIGLAWLNDRRKAARGKAQMKLMGSVDARKVLETRFASGDIDETEFNARMHRLIMGAPLKLD